MLNILLKNANQNIKDDRGRTPLHHASLRDQLEYLINQCKVDPNVKDNDGKTPLDSVGKSFLNRHKNLKCTKFLFLFSECDFACFHLY